MVKYVFKCFRPGFQITAIYISQQFETPAPKWCGAGSKSRGRNAEGRQGKRRASRQGPGSGLVKSRSPTRGPRPHPPYHTPHSLQHPLPCLPPPHRPRHDPRPTPPPTPHPSPPPPHPLPQDGSTPLHGAATNGRTEAVAALIAAKADLEARDKVRGAEGGGGEGGRSGGEGCGLEACRLERCRHGCGPG